MSPTAHSDPSRPWPETTRATHGSGSQGTGRRAIARLRLGPTGWRGGSVMLCSTAVMDDLAEVASNFTYITERGRTASGDPEVVTTIRATRRLDVDLHALLAERVLRQFLLGEYGATAIRAVREIVNRVRDLSDLDGSMIGGPLMQQVFSPDMNGPLVDAHLKRGEQLAAMYLFAGAICAFKNLSSHRQVDYDDPTVAAEAVLLMRLLDHYIAGRRTGCGASMCGAVGER